MTKDRVSVLLIDIPASRFAPSSNLLSYSVQWMNSFPFAKDVPAPNSYSHERYPRSRRRQRSTGSGQRRALARTPSGKIRVPCREGGTWWHRSRFRARWLRVQKGESGEILSKAGSQRRSVRDARSVLMMRRRADGAIKKRGNEDRGMSDELDRTSSFSTYVLPARI